MGNWSHVVICRSQVLLVYISGIGFRLCGEKLLTLRGLEQERCWTMVEGDLGQSKERWWNNLERSWAALKLWIRKAFNIFEWKDREQRMRRILDLQIGFLEEKDRETSGWTEFKDKEEALEHEGVQVHSALWIRSLQTAIVYTCLSQRTKLFLQSGGVFNDVKCDDLSLLHIASQPPQPDTDLELWLQAWNMLCNCFLHVASLTVPARSCLCDIAAFPYATPCFQSIMKTFEKAHSYA